MTVSPKARPPSGALAGILLAATVALAGCAPAPAATPVSSGAALAGLTFPTPAGALPVTVRDSTGAEVTIGSATRIVAVNGDLVEVVYALGLGDTVVARDLSATYPPEVEQLPVIGYQRALNPEPIAAFSPTVVLANTLAGPPGAIEQLRHVAPTVVLDYPDTVDGPPEKIRAVARVLGVPERGDRLAAQVETEIAEARERAGATVERPRVAVLYVRGPGVFLLLGAESGAGALVEAAGGVDVAAELGVADTAPVNSETLLAAAPDVLVVTTTGLESVGGIDGLLALENGALARTPAGRDRRVLAYEDQYLLGFGPRTGAVLAELTRDLHPDLEETP